MAYDDLFAVPGMDDEDQPEFGVPGLGGAAPDDINAQYLGLSRSLVDNAKRGDALRRQQLERATKLLQQRPMGQTMAERLLALSAAFVEPSRTRGFAGVLGNVVPVLADQAKQRRLGAATTADTLRELQDRYETEGITGERQSLRDQLAAIQARAAFNKPRRPQIMSDGNGRFGRVNEDGTMTEVPLQPGGPSEAHVAALRQHPDRAQDFDAKFGAGAAARILGTGGPTGSAPSGNFPTGNPLDRRSITGY